MRTTIEVSILSSVALLSHIALIPVGLAFMDADDATIPIVTTLFRRGHWSAFYLNQKYGGTTLTVLRTFWVSLWERIFHADPLAHITSQMSFTYGVVPVLLALASYALLRAYCMKRSSAFVGGLIAAVGLQFWIDETLERDFYTAYLVLGMLILALRGRVKNPWKELSPKGFFGVAVLSGLALYTCRASAIFVAAYFWPAEGSWSALARDPRRLFKVFPAHRIAILAAGVALGMLPEIAFILSHRTGTPMIAYGFVGLRSFLQAIRSLPHNLFLMVSGTHDWRAITSVGLLILGFWGFSLERQMSPETRTRLRPLLVAAILSLFAYSIVNQTAFGVPRYLLPLSPLWIVSIGVFLDHLAKISSRKDHRFRARVATILFAILLAAHVADQIAGRMESIKDARALTLISQELEVVSVFSKAKVKLVISDEYWEANQYTVLTQGKPAFISNGRDLGLPEAFELQRTEKRIGVLLVHSPPKITRVVLNGAGWELTPLARIGARQLYVGKRI